MKKSVPTAKKAAKKATPTKAPPKQKEKKPIAKKSAKKREAVSPIKKVTKTIPTKKKGRDVAGYLEFEMEPILRSIEEQLFLNNVATIRADSVSITRRDIPVLMSAPKKKKRDLLGEEDKTFDSVVFKACLDLLSTATREPVFSSEQYAAALRDCDASGLDVSAMLEVDIVSTWETADIERLISYLTTLCHIKRAYRSASETIPLAEVRQTTTA